MLIRISTLQAQHWSEVLSLQDTAYAHLGPEPADVMHSKWQVSPDTCFVAHQNDSLLGYVLAHPWAHPVPPALYQPTRPHEAQGSWMFIHDMAVAPEARGRGVAHLLFEPVLVQARHARKQGMLLVAVQGSTRFWHNLGFEPVRSVTPDLSSYGEHACLMQRTLSQELIPPIEPPQRADAKNPIICV